MAYRYRSSSETLNILSKYIDYAEISRVSDLSFMDDSTSLYVFSAIRANSKSLSVSLGKSDSKDQAKCSALMESIETYYAEIVKPDVFNLSEMELENRCTVFTRYEHAVIDKAYKINWCYGKMLLKGEKVLLPHCILSLDSTTLLPCLAGNSDGLASGNCFKEAIICSFLECVERASFVEKEVEVAGFKEHFRNIISNNVRLALYMYKNKYNIPTFKCVLNDSNFFNNTITPVGYGCHFDKKIAVEKAVHEAIQSRVGLISGARDDLKEIHYKPYKIKPLSCGNISFDEIDSYQVTLESQFQQMKDILINLKMDLVYYIYLEDDISVVKSFLVNNRYHENYIC